MNCPRLSDRKHAAIIAAAIEVFAECGFEGANMDAIADSAQASKRTVYNHFASKEMLFDAIVQDIKDRSLLAGTLEYCPQTPLHSQLVEFARRVVDFHCDATSRKLCRVILSRLLQHPEIAVELFGGWKLFEADLQHWIRKAVKDKRLAKLDAQIAGRQFLGLLETFAVWPQLIRNTANPTKSDRRRIVTECVEMFLARYTRRESY